MKNLIITFAFIILAVFITNTLILGNSDSLKTGVEGIGNNIVDELDSISGSDMGTD
jgi:hypothetical protein